MSESAVEATTYRIRETGQRVNGVELALHFQFGLWTARERDGGRWVVRTRDGETLTLLPVD